MADEELPPRTAQELMSWAQRRADGAPLFARMYGIVLFLQAAIAAIDQLIVGLGEAAQHATQRNKAKRKRDGLLASITSFLQMPAAEAVLIFSPTSALRSQLIDAGFGAVSLLASAVRCASTRLVQAIESRDNDFKRGGIPNYPRALLAAVVAAVELYQPAPQGPAAPCTTVAAVRADRQAGASRRRPQPHTTLDLPCGQHNTAFFQPSTPCNAQPEALASHRAFLLTDQPACPTCERRRHALAQAEQVREALTHRLAQSQQHLHQTEKQLRLAEEQLSLTQTQLRQTQEQLYASQARDMLQSLQQSESTTTASMDANLLTDNSALGATSEGAPLDFDLLDPLDSFDVDLSWSSDEESPTDKS
eukprot:m.170535 g.170535  ORF g.170535 m.170535 type:complete len:363 (+) comp53256_c0_seq3:388-1476(+)